MFFVLTERVVKFSTGATEKFSARSVNRTSWAVSGPFTKQALAERAAVSTMGTHTCLSSLIVNLEQLKALAKKNEGYELNKLVKQVTDSLAVAVG